MLRSSAPGIFSITGARLYREIYDSTSSLNGIFPGLSVLAHSPPLPTPRFLGVLPQSHPTFQAYALAARATLQWTPKAKHVAHSRVLSYIAKAMEIEAKPRRKKAPNTRRLGAYSRRYTRRIMGGWGPDGRSSEGKFARKLELELLGNLKRQPTLVQKLLVRRAVRIQLQLNALDEKMDAGNFTDHDRRVLGALNNAFRLVLRDLGSPDSGAEKPPALARLLAEMAPR